MNLIISPYSKNDDREALELESLCPQGKSISLKFERPAFHTRSEVYDNYKIFCAKHNNKLIGIVAGAEKLVQLNGRTIRSVYGYDLRVHPAYRKFGTAKKLTDAVLKSFGKNIDCFYTLVAGKNEKALAFIRRSVGNKVILPLVYIILPVNRKVKMTSNYHNISMNVAHENYLTKNGNIQFVPNFNENRMHGYVKSISLGDDTSTSIWTNENILAEQIAHIPWQLNIVRPIQRLLKPILNFPPIPKLGETIKSWFLFNLVAPNKDKLSSILEIINNLAFDQNKKFIYILLQESDPLLFSIKKLRHKMLLLPYYFLAKGRYTPNNSSKVYIDIRDL